MIRGWITNWWSKMGPYYTKAFPDIFVGFGIMSYVYYQLSYGGTKAVKEKPDH